MPEGISAALATPGVAWLALAMSIGGLVRGFTGFGSALIFMPVAAQFVPLPVAIVVLTLTDMISWPAIVPGALRRADRREVLLLTCVAIVAAPVGVWLLGIVNEGMLRWLVSLVVMASLAAMVAGWRYAGPRTPARIAGAGAAGGLLGGATGLAGPPVILFYLGGASTVASVRANTILYLSLLDIAILASLALQGQVGGGALWLAAVLVLPYGAALLAGQALFRPGHERLYRAFAYVTIAASALAGLPLFD